MKVIGKQDQIEGWTGQKTNALINPHYTVLQMATGNAVYFKICSLHLADLEVLITCMLCSMSYHARVYLFNLIFFSLFSYFKFMLYNDVDYQNTLVTKCSIN